MKELRVIRGVDLRLKYSEREAYAKPGCITVLVNNSHTICNVVLDNDPGFIGRKTLPRYLKSTTAKYLNSYLASQFSWLLVARIKTMKPPVPAEDSYTSKRAFAYYAKRRRGVA
jgi:hypothetical protein